MFKPLHVIWMSLFVSVSVWAQTPTSTVVLNEKISAKPTGQQKVFQIQNNTETQLNEFEIFIQNGNGLDYFPLSCSGSFVQKVLCGVENIKRAIFVKLDRPNQLQIKINNEVISDSNSFPPEKGQISIRRFLAGQQQLSVLAKGLPIASVTVRVSKFLQINQSPIADFIYSSVSDVEPSLVSFSAMLSHDPDGSIVNYEWDFGDGSFGQGVLAQHIYQQAGIYAVMLKVTDDRGAQTQISKNVTIRPDVYGPVLSQISPPSNSEIETNQVVLSGLSDESLSQVTVQINAEPPIQAQISDKSFSVALNFLQHGSKQVTITAYDLKNNQSSVVLTYNLTFNSAPIAQISIKEQNSTVAPSMIWFNGSGSSDADGDTLTYEWDFDDNSELSYEEMPAHLFAQAGTYDVTLKVTDSFGAQNTITKTITLTAPVLPEDPTTQAPPIAEDTLPTNEEKYGFLFQGENPIQKDVDVTQIEAERITPISGRVMKNASEPLEAVKVTVKDHPEYGYTLTREDGKWDLVINGGGEVFVEFEKAGFGQSMRQVDTNNNAARTLEDIILVAIDEKKTLVVLNSDVPQVHEATVVQDEDGIRRAQVVIPENTSAQIVLPDGTTRSVEQVTIRATEFTVGDEGEKRMPSQLPPRTAYTYAADFTADEAIAMGGGSVEFSKPVPIYVDNFLNLPTGIAIPVGYLNPENGFWEQMPNGVVIKVLSIDAEQKAQIAVDRTEAVANATQLQQLSINDAELKVIAQKFTAGQSFWRAQSTHFSTIDLNGNLSSADILNLPKNKEEICIPCMTATGCEIDVQRQLLSEKISLPALGGHQLVYSNDRVEGRKVPSTIYIRPFNNFTMNSQTQPLINASIKVEIAGKVHTNFYPAPHPVQTFTYVWDGRDNFGRKIYGSQRARVTIEYLYPQTYEWMWYDASLPSVFDTSNPNADIFVSPSRKEYRLVHTFDTIISSPYDVNRTKAMKQFGGWTFDAYHSYDRENQNFYKGNGETIKSNTISAVVSTVAGNGAVASGGDGGLATEASLNIPTAISSDAAGNLYVAEAGGHRIRKIKLDGTIETVAGNGGLGYTGDGGLAVNAAIGSPRAIRVKEDGTIFFNDFVNHVTRKISPRGIISTVAGTGVAGYSGDNGPARLAKLNGPRGLAIGSDGSLYISDSNNNVLRRVWTDGKITTYAGTGVAGFSGDGGAAVDAQFNFPNFTEIDKSGNIYVADSANNRIRRISATGIITTIAGRGGNPDSNPTAQNIPATFVALNNPTTVKVNDSGEVYFSEQNANVIRKIDNRGLIYTVVGTGVAGYNGDGLIGSSTNISSPRGFIIDSSDNVIFTDGNNHRVRKVANSLQKSFPAFIPSTDGTEIYFFNAKGLHERTTFADTGAIKYEFTHDNNNDLIAITDAHQKVTTINRSGDGSILSMTGPYGQSYQFGLTNGFLTSLSDPLGNTHNMIYTADGLLTSFQKPEGNAATYQYDGLGRLSVVTEPNGGVKHLDYIAEGDYVNFTQAEGSLASYQFQQNSYSPTSIFFLLAKEDGGIFQMFSETRYGYEVSISQDGLQTLMLPQSDQRFPGFAKYYGGVSETYTKNGNIFNSTGISRSYAFKPDNINFVRTETTADSANFNETSTFDSITKVTQTISATGRRSSFVTDDQLKLRSLQIGTNFFPVNYSYDNDGRLTQISQGDRTTTMVYDQNGFLSEITDPENRTTRFIKDAIGRTIRTITPDLAETFISYDRNSNVTGITPPDRLVHTFINNSIDLLASYAAPNAAGSKNYSYDGDQRIRSIASEENISTNFNYGRTAGQANNNKLIDILTPTLNINYNYHTENKWLQDAISSDGQNITYDRASDLLLSKSYSGLHNSTVSYVYNQLGVMQASESLNGNAVTQQFNRDKLLIENGALTIARDASTGLPTQKAVGNQVENISYNQFGEIAERDYRRNNVSLYKEVYTRDRLGRITQKQIVRPASTITHTYTYDLKGRLKTFSLNGNLQTTYNYDVQGNRLSTISNTQTVFTGVYDGRDRLTSYTRGANQFTLALNEDDSVIVKNNVTANVQTTYRVSQLNSLQSVEIVTPTTTKTITYKIDGENKRAAKLVNGLVTSYLVYDKYQRLIAEFNANHSLKSRFFYGTQDHSPDYMTNNGEQLFFVKDQLGSILQVVNSTGVIRQELQYNLLGEVTSDSNPGFQPFGYAGGHYDFETGLVRYGARDYDSSVGRWLQKDPIGFGGGDSNLYVYSENDFVNKNDPSGTGPISAMVCLQSVGPLALGGQALTYLNIEKDIIQVKANISDLEQDISKHQDSLCMSQRDMRAQKMQDLEAMKVQLNKLNAAQLLLSSTVNALTLSLMPAACHSLLLIPTIP